MLFQTEAAEKFVQWIAESIWQSIFKTGVDSVSIKQLLLKGFMIVIPEDDLYQGNYVENVFIQVIKFDKIKV